MSKRLIYEEDAIDALKQLQKSISGDYTELDPLVMAGCGYIGDCIGELECLPSTQPECTQECMSMYADVSDNISRQAAIDSIEKHLRFGDELYPLTDTDKVMNHAFEIATSCVYNLPSAQPETHDKRTETHSCDLISRQAAIDEAYEIIIDGQKFEVVQVETLMGLPPAQHEVTVADINEYCYKRCLTVITNEFLHKLQSAQPERMKSRWCDGRCLRCGEHAPFYSMASAYYESNFCPNCGADMRGEQDGKNS